MKTSTFFLPKNSVFALYGFQNKQLLLSCSKSERICNRDEACLQRGTSWIYVYNYDIMQPLVLGVKLNQLV